MCFNYNYNSICYGNSIVTAVTLFKFLAILVLVYTECKVSHSHSLAMHRRLVMRITW